MPRSVLIVDDNPALRQSIRKLVERNPEYEISGEAENGLVAIQKVEEFRPDIVLLDLQMPVMDGLQAAKEIKVLAPTTKILMFTMHDSEQIREFAMSAGVDGVVSKSIGSNELITFLRNACAKDS